jgi:hypothetical protein
MNAQGGADALGAIREAIRMYMGMREDRMDRDRMALSDARADRALTLQEQNAAEDMRAGQRRSVEFLVQNFGGQQADPADAARARELGYGSTLEEKPATLPFRTASVPFTHGLGEQPQAGMPSPMNTIAQRMDGQQAGTYWKQPESERSRVAALNAQTRMYEGAANRNTRLEVAGMQTASAEKRAQLAAALGRARIDAQRYATDIASRDRIAGLLQRGEQFSALLGDRDIDNAISRYRALGPLAFLEALQGGGGADPLPIQPIQPQQPAPPPMGGGGNWEVLQ